MPSITIYKQSIHTIHMSEYIPKKDGKKGAVYLIKRKYCGHQYWYIGQSIRVKKRIEEHFASKANDRFHKDIRRLGRNAFTWKILARVQCENLEMQSWILKAAEREFIKLYEPGYNETSGGDGPVPNPYTKKQVAKICPFLREHMASLTNP